VIEASILVSLSNRWPAGLVPRHPVSNTEGSRLKAECSSMSELNDLIDLFLDTNEHF
jgi:hypothetical protein